MCISNPIGFTFKNISWMWLLAIPQLLPSCFTLRNVLIWIINEATQTQGCDLSPALAVSRALWLSLAWSLPQQRDTVANLWQAGLLLWLFVLLFPLSMMLFSQIATGQVPHTSFNLHSVVHCSMKPVCYYTKPIPSSPHSFTMLTFLSHCTFLFACSSFLFTC